VSHARIRSLNQPVLGNERKVSCSRKQVSLQLFQTGLCPETSVAPFLNHLGQSLTQRSYLTSRIERDWEIAFGHGTVC